MNDAAPPWEYEDEAKKNMFEILIFGIATAQWIFRYEFLISHSEAKVGKRAKQITWFLWKWLNIIKSLPHTWVYFVYGICVAATIVCGFDFIPTAIEMFS